METKQKTLAIHSILSSPRGLLLAHLPPDKRSSFTSIKCIKYTIVAQQFHHSFFSTKKKKKQKNKNKNKIHHPLCHNFCQA